MLKQGWPDLRTVAAGVSIAGLLAVAASPVAAADGGSVHVGPPLARTHFATGANATRLCNALFTQKTDVETAVNKVAEIYKDVDRLNRPADSFFSVDDSRRTITVRRDGYERTARFYPGHGCSLLPVGFNDLYSAPPDPQAFAPQLPDDFETAEWPRGERVDGEAALARYDKAKIEEGLAKLFAPEAMTNALIVVKGGRIVLERYRLGTNADTLHESWSAGKSIVGTLVGVLAQRGALRIDDPAPIPEWNRIKDDPRARIRVRDLMNMSGGLRFSGRTDPEWKLGSAVQDHLRVYYDSLDTYAFSLAAPPEFEPGTNGRYLNSDPLALATVIKAEAAKENMHTRVWLQRVLFDKLSIPGMHLGPDAYGNVIFTGNNNGRARDWARLGLLYLNKGSWSGEQIIPADFVDFVAKPGPGWKQANYGGLVWLNGETSARGGKGRVFPALPADAYYFAGAGGQVTIVIPSLDMVIVRMGYYRGADSYVAEVNAGFEPILAAIK